MHTMKYRGIFNIDSLILFFASLPFFSEWNVEKNFDATEKNHCVCNRIE